MRAGRLTDSIIIERETVTITDAGHTRKAWTPLAGVRAEIKRATASEYLTGFGEADPTNAVFVIRWIPGLDLTTADRIMHRGRMFNIKAIVEVGRRRAIELRAVAA